MNGNSSPPTMNLFTKYEYWQKLFNFEDFSCPFLYPSYVKDMNSSCFIGLTKIEGYFKTTLPQNPIRIYRTRQELIRWMRLQKILWTEKNVLYNESKKNFQIHLNDKKNRSYIPTILDNI